jgi:uncharacterized protein (UPF0179 family)
MSGHGIVTLVGEAQAKPGARFEYLGLAPECEPCRLRAVCHAKELSLHREYEVKAVRGVHHECPAGFFEGGMRVAEVGPVPVRSTIPASALRGTGVTHAFEECGAACLFRRLCDTPALPAGADCTIKEVQGPVACKVGRDLRFALLEPRRGKAQG